MIAIAHERVNKQGSVGYGSPPRYRNNDDVIVTSW
jgi:hypothetical protein